MIGASPEQRHSHSHPEGASARSLVEERARGPPAKGQVGYPCAAWSRFRVAFLTQFPLGVSVRSLVEGAARQPKHPGTRGICAQPGRGGYFRISASSLMGDLCAARLRSPRRTSHSPPGGVAACGWGREDGGWGGVGGGWGGVWLGGWVVLGGGWGLCGGWGGWVGGGGVSGGENRGRVG